MNAAAPPKVWAQERVRPCATCLAIRAAGRLSLLVAVVLLAMYLRHVPLVGWWYALLAGANGIWDLWLAEHKGHV